MAVGPQPGPLFLGASEETKVKRATVSVSFRSRSQGSTAVPVPASAASCCAFLLPSVPTPLAAPPSVRVTRQCPHVINCMALTATSKERPLVSLSSHSTLRLRRVTVPLRPGTRRVQLRASQQLTGVSQRVAVTLRRSSPLFSGQLVGTEEKPLACHHL